MTFRVRYRRAASRRPAPPDGSVAYTYSIRPVSPTYLISRDGKILWRAFGVREWESSEAREYFARVLSDGKR